MNAVLAWSSQHLWSIGLAVLIVVLFAAVGWRLWKGPPLPPKDEFESGFGP